MSSIHSNNKQIARNLIFNTISFIINFVISFCFTPYLIRVVGKEAYSFFPLVNNIIGYSSIITAAVGSMGGRFITMSLYRNDKESANQYFNSVWVANIFLSILFTLISIFAIIFISNILTVPEYLLGDVQFLFAFGTLSMILGLITGLLGLGTYVKNRLDLQASRNVFTNMIRVLCILLLFYLFKPSIVFMSLSAFIAALVGVYFNLSFKKRLLPELNIAPSQYFSWNKLKETTSSGIWNSVSQLSNTLLYQLDLFITNIFISASITGDYAIAKTAPNLILQLLAMLSGTFVAHFNILYAKGQIDQVVSETRKSMVIVGMLIGLPIGFLVVFSDIFYQLWVPGQDSEFLYWLTVYSVLPMVLGGSINPIFGIFTTTNKLRIPSLVVLFSGLFQILVILILLKFTSLGIWSIAITSMVQSVLRNSIFTPIYGAIVLKKKWFTFYPTMIRGIAGVGVVIILGSFYKNNFIIDDWTHFIIAGIVVCGFSLFINSFVMLSRIERQSMISKILRKKDNV